jgi:putative membrane protein
MWYYQYYWGMTPLWWVVWFIILVWIFALPFGIPGQRHRREAPLDILKKRFARGEINHQEYEQRKAALEKK